MSKGARLKATLVSPHARTTARICARKDTRGRQFIIVLEGGIDDQLLYATTSDPRWRCWRGCQALEAHATARRWCGRRRRCPDRQVSSFGPRTDTDVNADGR